MSVNKNRLVLNFYGAFQEPQQKSLTKDFLGMVLGEALKNRAGKDDITGETISDRHRRITINYDGPRFDQTNLLAAFQFVTMGMPNPAALDITPEPSTIDTINYGVHARF